jgi:ATPase subunit of ABC transporter with duplicated ATPase domains
MSHALVINDLHFRWPEGAVVFDGLSFAVGSGRTGLVGANGSGKSTLFRLVTGELTPQGGSVTVAGTLGYLRQDLTLDAGLAIDAVLGIDGVRRALHAIESGDVTDEHFAAVGDDWDVDERARATLDRLGLAHVELDRRVGELSGGEAVLLGLAAQFLRRPDVLLLDEPTNNLDIPSVERLEEALLSFLDEGQGSILTISHDRAFLDTICGRIVELDGGVVRDYPGGFSWFDAHRGQGKEITVRPPAPPSPPKKAGKQRRERAVVM